MKRILILTAAIVYFAAFKSNAQEESDKFKTEVSGSIWFQYYYDTYQSVETRDGALLLYPKPMDAAKINENGKLGSSAFFSRLRAKFSGSEAFGAKASGMLEGDFFATSQDFVGHLRLRHAFVKLDWDNSSLTVGQYWHPIIATEVIPSSDLIANVPYFPLNRSPQVSFTYNLTNEISILGSALTHSYHRSSGPIDMQRNAGLPELAGKLKYKSENFVFGINGGIKILKPRLVTEGGLKSNKTISTPYIGSFARVKTKLGTIKGQVVYGENLTHFVMIGGMGASGDTTGVDDYNYSALKTLSLWSGFCSSGDKIQYGLFFGYSKLLGATEDYTSLSGLTRTSQLSHTMRVAPRLDFLTNRMKFGIEYILTSAVYGSSWDSKYKATATLDPVFNSRLLLHIKYDF